MDRDRIEIGIKKWDQIRNSCDYGDLANDNPRLRSGTIAAFFAEFSKNAVCIRAEKIDRNVETLPRRASSALALQVLNNFMLNYSLSSKNTQWNYRVHICPWRFVILCRWKEISRFAKYFDHLSTINRDEMSNRIFVTLEDRLRV